MVVSVRSVARALGLIVVVAMLTGRSAAAQNVGRAAEAYQNAQWGTVIAELDPYLATTPGDGFARLMNGVAYLQIHDWRKAIEHFEYLLNRIDSGSCDARFWMAVAYEKLGRTDKLVNEMERMASICACHPRWLWAALISNAANFRHPFNINYCKPYTVDARFVTQTVPSEMIAGHSYTIQVEFRNPDDLHYKDSPPPTGDPASPWAPWPPACWDAAYADTTVPPPCDTGNRIGPASWWIGTEWYRLAVVTGGWGVSNVLMHAGDSVKSGETRTFALTVRAPAQPGTYPFQVRMARRDAVFGQPSPLTQIVVKADVPVSSGPPVAKNDKVTTNRDTGVTIDVVANDRHPDGHAITLTDEPITTLPRHGTAARWSDRTIRYTPNARFAGNDAFEYEVKDPSGNTARAWVGVRVKRTKALPNAQSDSLTIPANQSQVIDVVANDSSPDDEPLMLLDAPLLVLPAHGTVTRISDTLLSYTPHPDFVGTDTFEYEISDSEEGTVSATVSVTVQEGNRKPVAVADAAGTGVGRPVTIEVTLNDSDPDGDAVVLVSDPIVVPPANGTATRVSADSIAYAPRAGFAGSDSFQYEIGDGHGRRARATVTVTVSDTNHLPEAVDDSAVTPLGTAVTVDVTANDSDADGDRVALIAGAVITLPSNGTAVKISGSSITYTPRNGFSGTDTFQYEIGDGSAGRARAWVTVTVGSGTPNRNPVAVDDQGTTRISTPIDAGVTANDSDPDGDAVWLVSGPVIVPPSHGTAIRLDDSTLRYVPQAGFVGADMLQYEIGDGKGKRARAWLRITIQDSNNPPVAVDDVATVKAGRTVTLRVVDNDSDPDGDTVWLVASPVIVPPQHGTATRIDDDAINFTAQAGYQGTDRFQYEIGDGHGKRRRAWVNITITHGSGASNAAAISSDSIASGMPLIADNDVAEGSDGGSVTISVLSNDYTADGRRVTLAAQPVLTPPLSGDVVRVSDTTLRYTPVAGFRGNDRFEYEIVSSDGTSAQAWATVQIPGDNRAPAAVSDDVAVSVGGSRTIAVAANDTDPDGDPLTLSPRAVLVAPVHGRVRPAGGTSLVYTPIAGFSGSDSFVYQISDGRGGTAEGCVTVSVSSQIAWPVARDDSATTDRGRPVSLNVLGNDDDPDGDPLSLIAADLAQHGSVVWNDDGTATYTPDPNYVGSDSFTYTAADRTGLTAQATVTITIIGTNRTPVVANDSTETKTRTETLIGVLANDWDPDYPTRLSVSAVTQPAHGSVAIHRGESVVYTPASDFAGIDTFQYTASDGQATATAQVTVNVLNQAPLPRSEILSALEDVLIGYQSYNVLGNDVDPDGDELHIVRVEQPGNGTFSISPDSSQFSYKPKENWSGIDSFYYTVGDPFGAEVRLMSQIRVSAVNDAPVANNDTFSVYKNQLLTITQAQVVANDTDIEGHTISIYSVGPAANGTATKLADGSIEYRPYGEFVGTDSFEYIADDSGGGAYATGRITVNVLQDTAPVAAFTATCTNRVCSFDASASTDDRGIVSYEWTLGNGSPAAGKTFTYTYPAAGTFQVRLTVRDALGQSGVLSKWITTCEQLGIATQPASQTIYAGATATFSVAAQGSGPYSYQWYEGASGTTTTPVGTNSNTFTTPPLSASKSYWVRVTSTCSGTVSVNSSTATANVCVLPGIAAHPASQTITINTAATLTVTPSGSGPFSYQWYEGTTGTTTKPVGTNGSTFITPALTVNASYWVRVTSSCGPTVSVSSNTATITVRGAIVRRQKAAVVANSQTSVTAGWTQPTQAGTLLVAVISAENGSYPVATFTPPAGWIHAATSEWNNLKTSIYYYPNNPGGRTSETFTTGAFRDQILQLAEYEGARTTSPLDRTAAAGDNTASGNLVFTGTTPVTSQAKELVVTALTMRAPTQFSAPTDGFVEVHDHTISWWLSTAVHERVTVAAGAYGHSATVDAAAQWVGVVATFRAADATP